MHTNRTYRTSFAGTRGRRAFARGRGLVVAGATVLVFACVLGYFVWRAPRSAGTDSGDVTALPPPDIKDIPVDSSGEINSRLGSGVDFFMQVVDENDPTRVKGELRAARSEPLEARRYRMEKPRAWLYMADGRTLYFEAESGRAYVPDETPGARPREVVLEGDVVMKMFAQREDGKRADPAVDDPLLTVSTPVLMYDGALGQVRLPKEVDIASDTVDFGCRDLTALFNEAEEHPEFLHIVERTRPLTITQRPREAKPAQPAPTKPAAPSGAAAPAKPPKPAPATPVESLYRLVAEGDVVVTQGGRRISADRLEAWVRMFDNKLRDGAIARKERSTRPDLIPTLGPLNLPPVAFLSALAVAQTAPPPDKSLSLEAENSEPIVVSWSGPLEVRPLQAATRELGFNDVFLRFSSARPHGVTVTDQRSRAKGTGNLAEYGATTRDVAIEGDGPKGARVELPRSGTGEAHRFDVNLGNGRVSVPGAGILTAAPRPSTGETDTPVPARTLAWSNQADFFFVVDNGEVTSRLSEVRSAGNVLATDGDGSLGGDLLTGRFADNGENSSHLTHLNIIGNATGKDGRGGSLAGDTLDIAFDGSRGDEQPDPSLLTARGNVRAERDSAALAADFLEATIDRDAAQELVVTNVEARDRVVFTDGQTGAKADRLIADPVAQTATLEGDKVHVTREGAVVTGRAVRFDGIQRRMDVDTAGTLTYIVPPSEDSQGGREPDSVATASWTDSMTFTDTTGEAECRGDVHAEWVQGQIARDSMQAETVFLTFTPAPEEATVGDASTPAPERTLQSVRAVGTLADNPDGDPAKIESRRYAPTTALGEEPTLERLVYLEGASIVADNAAGTLTVPGAGKLLALDRRAAQEAGVAGGKQLDFSGPGSRGAALFSWSGSMLMDRPKGSVRMEENVRLRHSRLLDGRITELECETLTAKFSETARPESGAGSVLAAKPALEEQFAGELIEADATGSVWMRSANKELVADSLKYDAAAGMIDARAGEGSFVTLFDPATATPITARQILWRLSDDRIEAREMGPIVAPR